MRPRLVKRIAATLLMGILLFGEAMPALADTIAVVTTSDEKVNITVEYLREVTEVQKDGKTVKKEYRIVANQTQECVVGSTITFNDTDLENYRLAKVVVDADNDQYDRTYENVSQIPGDIEADVNKTIKLYFQPNEKDFYNSVTMFDYDVKGDEVKELIKCAATTTQSTLTSVTKFKSITFDGVKLSTLNGSTSYYYWAWNEYNYNGKNYIDLVLMKKTSSGISKVDSGDKYTIKDWDSSNHKFSGTTSGGVTYDNISWNGTEKKIGITLEGGINSNYYTNASGTTHYDKYLAMGSYGGDKAQTIPLMVNKTGVGTLNANENNAHVSATEDDGTKAIVPGLVAGLSEDYRTLNMAQGIHEPGYFSDKLIEGKSIYDTRYRLQFKQVGDSYTLYRVDDRYVLDLLETNTKAINLPTNSNDYSLWNVYNSKAADQGIRKDFFPLDRLAAEKKGEYNDEVYQSKSDHTHAHSGGCNHNCYFGMRYDFEFSIGEYIGPLKYTFAGDDDLWVFLDGELVLDLGGMHSAYPTAANYNDNSYEKPQVKNPLEPYEVDLWGVILERAGLLDNRNKIHTISEAEKENLIARFNTEKAEEKGESHRVTVLYMERGGYDSSCYMNFIIPNVGDIGSVIQKPADFELIKKDALTEKVIPNVGFTLYTNKSCTSEYAIREAVTDSNGRVRFSDLEAGTYYLKETSWNENAYIADSNIYTVIVTVEGMNSTATVDIMAKDENGVYVVYNIPIPPTKLQFNKIDRYTQGVVPGAKFELIKDSLDGEVVGEVVSDENGHFEFPITEAGTYYLKEISAPAGYVQPGVNVHWTFKIDVVNCRFVITESSSDLELKDNSYVIENEPYVSFEFTKIDSVTKNPINNVEFTLYEGTSNNLIGTDKGVKAKSNSDGIVTFNNLRVGQNYLLVETKVAGYEAPKTPWVIRVDRDEATKQFVYKISVPTLENGEWKFNTETVDINRIIENTPATGSLRITKVVDEINMVYGAPTFTFEIVGPNGLVMYKTITFGNAADKEESIVVENLPLGEYTVTELSNIRYTLTSAVVVDNNREVTEEYTPHFWFNNELASDDDYSHSDVVVNSFRTDDDGNIVISKDRYVEEQKVVDNQ